MDAWNSGTFSADHCPGWVIRDVSSVMTSMRRMQAIRPTIRNGSHTRVPARSEACTVCRISTSISTNSRRSMMWTVASVPVQSCRPVHSVWPAPANAMSRARTSITPMIA